VESLHGTPVRLSQCAKTFADGTKALEPTDLEINSGEVVVVLGPSGCGKTTLLRIVAGLEQPDAGGTVLFGAEDVTRFPIETRNVGMVFQSYALFPNMTVEENVAYGLRVRRVRRTERLRQAHALLEMMQITTLAKRRIDQLSGGQKQRVALARALAIQPRVLLLDEPLTALDAKLRDTLRQDLNALLRRVGVTSVYVTHDQGEAMALGDRIVVMSKGRVEQIGRPRQIYFSPANRFVAGFIGTMNLFSGSAANGFVDVAGGRIPLRDAQTGLLEVLIRPEGLAVSSEAEAHIRGKVQQALFLGDRLRLLVAIEHGSEITVETSARTQIEPGQSIYLRVDPDAVMVLPK
jgi:putative spermidine/putrescine transport system ATP-binding protein